MPTAAALVLAGGTGSRVGAEGNKVYLPLAGRPLITWSLTAMLAAPSVGRVVLVARADEQDLAAGLIPPGVELTVGGATRHESEDRGLAALAADIDAGRIDVVAVHDGARPLVTVELIEQTVAGAREHGAVLPGLTVTDLMTADGRALSGPHVRVQTPQAFEARALLGAYRAAHQDGFTGTDTAACVERYTALRVHCLPGRSDNVKVTYRRDLDVAERLLALRH